MRSGCRPLVAQVLAALACLALVAGCGTDAPVAEPAAGKGGGPTSVASSEASPSPRQSGIEDERARTVLKVATSEFGPMLFDNNDQAIYLFDRESTERPRCYGGCAEAWPPVLTEAGPRGAGAVRPNLLGTTRRRDGTTQVTYAGHPLYYYAHEGPNEVLCHDVTGYGGLWLVVTPSGEPAPH